MPNWGFEFQILRRNTVFPSDKQLIKQLVCVLEKWENEQQLYPAESKLWDPVLNFTQTIYQTAGVRFRKMRRSDNLKMTMTHNNGQLNQTRRFNFKHKSYDVYCIFLHTDS